MEENTYTWEQLRAYSIIALSNLLNSENAVSLKRMKLYLDSLQTIHHKDGIIGYSQRLLEKEEKENSIKRS